MSESSDKGPQGTTRVSPEGPAQGPQGTTRVSPSGPALGPQGTTRVSPDGPAQGPQGTSRVSPGGALQGKQGTARVSGDQSQAGAGPGTAANAARYSPGQTVQLNGMTYRVEGELTNTSSEAVTYRVERGNTMFVLKQYHRGIAMPRDVLAQIKNLPHRNVVRVEDFGALDGQDAEIIELLPAGNLDQYLRRRGPMRDLPTLRKLARGILDGLHHLHSGAGVIYQDLKPENILLGDESLNRIVLADFGISSLVKPGQSEATVKANGTKEYAAPELARFGNQTDVSVDGKVDYFAFGVTLLECWLGRRPFEGVPDAARLRQVRDMDLAFPADIDPQLKLLITGLLKPLPKERWGREEITRWLEGKTFGASDNVQRRQYGRRWFNDQESFSTPAELATLLERYPAKGVDYLYLGRIGEWLDAAGDMDLSTEVLKITRNFDKEERLRRAGLIRAIYALDPARPFVTAGGRTCRTGEEVGDAFWEERAHYTQALKDPVDPFHLYLQATGEGNTSAEILKLHLSARSPELAFNTTVYALQGGGRDRLKLGDRFYFSCEDINADPQAQAALRTELRTANSRGLIWLRKLGIIENLETLDNAGAADAMAILKAFPWLTIQSDAPGLLPRQAQLADALVDTNRVDLLDVYRARGLQFDCDDRADLPPLHHAARTGNEAMARYLLDHGASVGYKDHAGATALLVAVEYRKAAVARLLMERGSDVSGEDDAHMTPLGAACSQLNMGLSTYQISPELVALLVANGAQPDQPFLGGQLPLHRALIDCDTAASAQAIMESLVQAGGSLTRHATDSMFRSQNGYDALFCCLFAYKHLHRQDSTFLPLIARIVQLGGKVNGFHEGKTPLHHAALWGDEPLCRALLAAGASRTVASSDDLLPAALALAHNNRNVSSALAHLLRPSAGFVARARLLLVLEQIVRCATLGLLAICIAPIWQIFRAPETKGVIGLLAVYVVLQIPVAAARLVVLGSDTAFVAWLRALSVRDVVMSLLVFPPVALAVSFGTSALLGAPPKPYVIGNSYIEACIAFAVSLLVAGAAVFGSLNFSRRTEQSRKQLAGIGVSGVSAATAGGRSGLPSLPPAAIAAALIVIALVGVVARYGIQGIQGLHGIVASLESKKAASTSEKAPYRAREEALFPELHRALERKIGGNPYHQLLPVNRGFDVKIESEVETSDGCVLRPGATYPLRKIRLGFPATDWLPGSVDVSLPKKTCGYDLVGRINDDENPHAENQLSKIKIVPERGVVTPTRLSSAKPSMPAAHPETPPQSGPEPRSADAVLVIPAGMLHKVQMSQEFVFPAGVRFVQPRQPWPGLSTVRLSQPTKWLMLDGRQCMVGEANRFNWNFGRFPCEAEPLAIPEDAVQQVQGQLIPGDTTIRYVSTRAITVRYVRMTGSIPGGTKLYRAGAPAATPADLGYYWPADAKATWFRVDPAACVYRNGNSFDCSQPIPLPDNEWRASN